MGKKSIEIDGFWVFIILVFVIVPFGEKILDTIKELNGAKDSEIQSEAVEKKETDQFIKVGYSASTISINGYQGQAKLNQEVKISIKEKSVRGQAESPSKETINFEIKNGYMYCLFNETGIWNVSVYDAHGLSTEWFQITVY